MTANNWKVIFGPPGTGKTSTLLGIVDKLLGSGYDARTIGFMAFTRKAANEAKVRAMNRFRLDQEDLPYFRTLHSLAYRQLGLNKAKVLGLSDLFTIAQSLGLYITLKGVQDDGTITGLTKGDRLFFMEAMARARLLDLKTYWEQFPDEDISYYELELVKNTILAYKKDADKIDFSDMIEEFCRLKPIPAINTLIIDEAQDLSPLQWKMVDTLASNVGEVYIAGDDDQAIFHWAGADVERFISLGGSKKVLTKSYRCPKAVHVIADNIITQLEARVEKRYQPADHDGSVEWVGGLEQIDMSSGEWLILGRNVYLLEEAIQHCITSGYLFSSPFSKLITGPEVHAIISWENLRKGQSITYEEVTNIYDHMTVRQGFTYGNKKRLGESNEATEFTMQMLKSNYGLLVDSIWHEALDRLNPQTVEYVIASLRRGEKLLKEPRIKINTIHGVKGGEADNVVVLTDMAPRTYDEFQKQPDHEHRVWYVAVTRTRKNLFIVEPKTEYCYDLFLVPTAFRPES